MKIQHNGPETTSGNLRYIFVNAFVCHYNGVEITGSANKRSSVAFPLADQCLGYGKTSVLQGEISHCCCLGWGKKYLGTKQYAFTHILQ
ncbi:unnamed protein product [Caretta caretta]